MRLLFTLNKSIIDFASIFYNALKVSCYYSAFKLHVFHVDVFSEKCFIDYRAPITFLAVDCQ